jgi:broad specificity phosphatase PhoE
MKTAWYAVLMIVSLAAGASAQQTVFVVRHAERADTAGGAAPTMAADPELSAAGRARAESLAAALKDAKIVAIFSTEFKRTRSTAEPLAKALGVQVTTISSKEPAKLIEVVKGVGGNVLVVGHSNTVPAIIKDLGVAAAVTVGDDEYDNLFVVTMGATPSALRLHYR